jgi:hypothetical protein
LKLASLTGQGQSLHYAALALFIDGSQVDEAPLRTAYQWVIANGQRRLDAAAARSPDGILDEADRAVRGFGWHEALLLPTVFPDLLSDYPRVSRRAARARAARRKALREAMWAAVVLTYDPGQVPPDMAAEAIDAIGWKAKASELREAILKAARDRVELFEDGEPHPGPTRVELAATLPVATLAEARYAARVAGAATWLLRLDALFDRAAWELLGHIEADENLAMVRWIPLITPAQPAHVVHSTLMLGADDDMRGVARVYGERVLPLAMRTYARLSERLAGELGDTIDPAALRELENLADLMDGVAYDEEPERIVFEAGVATVESLQMELVGLIDNPAA